MRVARGALSAGIAASVAACALFSDVDGFTSGEPDTGTPEAAVITSADASVEAAVDASFDAPPDAPSFRDEFARADGPDLGNGWTEKTPDVYVLLAGVVAKGQTSTHYRDNLAYRPASEDRADVEIAATFTVASPNGFPQVFARAQRTTIATPAAYDGYIFFLSELGLATVARQHGDAAETPLASITLASPLVPGSRVRLTLRTYGQTPTVLEAFADRIEGSGATRLRELKISDGDVARIDGPGAVGFTSSFEAVSAIDDFEWHALGAR